MRQGEKLCGTSHRIFPSGTGRVFWCAAPVKKKLRILVPKEIAQSSGLAATMTLVARPGQRLSMQQIKYERPPHRHFFEAAHSQVVIPSCTSCTTDFAAHKHRQSEKTSLL